MSSKKVSGGANWKKKEVKFVIKLFFTNKIREYKKNSIIFYTKHNYQINAAIPLDPLKIRETTLISQLQKLKQTWN